MEEVCCFKLIYEINYYLYWSKIDLLKLNEYLCLSFRNEIPGVVHVEIYPQKGLIKPMAVKTFRVTIYTKEYPCVIDVNLPCEFINTSQRRTYQRNVYKLEDVSRELKGHFTITEKGVNIPVNRKYIYIYMYKNSIKF